MTGAMAAQAVATAAAIAFAAGRRAHAPPALFLAARLLTSFLRTLLVASVLAPARAKMVVAGLDPAAVPFTAPLALGAVYLDGAMWLAGGPVALAALCVAVFTRTPRRWLVVVAVAWLCASVALAVTYPATRGPALARAYFDATLCSLATSLACVVTWAWLRIEPNLSHAVALLALALALAETIAPDGPWACGNPFLRWASAEDMHALLYVMIVTVVAVEVFQCSSPSSS